MTRPDAGILARGESSTPLFRLTNTGEDGGEIACPRKGTLAIMRCLQYQRETGAAGSTCTCPTFAAYRGAFPELASDGGALPTVGKIVARPDSRRSGAAPQRRRPTLMCQNCGASGVPLGTERCPSCGSAGMRKHTISAKQRRR